MSKIKTFFLIILGTIFTAISISLFLAPNKIVSGGISGLSILLYNAFNVPLGLSYIIINTLFLLIGFSMLGRTFILKTFLGVISLSLFVELFSYIPSPTDNILIAVIFGGAFSGVGIGLAFAAGATTGGTDIICRLLQKKFKSLPIGTVLMVADGIIILSSFFVFDNVDLVFFGIITMYITTQVIDYVIRMLNVSKIAFVITDKGEEISKKIVSSSSRGVTLINAVGGYTNENKKILFCAMKEREAPEFQKNVITIDKNAFVVFVKSQQILGNGFYIYS